MCVLNHEQSNEELLVVVGGGAAGIYGAIWAKTVAPNLNVIVIEKGQPLSKVPSHFLVFILCGAVWLDGKHFLMEKFNCRLVFLCLVSCMNS